MFIVSLENINLDSLETFLVTLGEGMDLKVKVNRSGMCLWIGKTDREGKV